ncbi:MAG: sodium/pantothenate symporter [Candidatus Anaerobiospirillum pullicola]|uniref:Sodium/pantothenate symporter n=1 Tax=Candidatus Anaerobiospirillum pullicola TaxID=2838451 RepID=A0A948TGZ3_9GAMM|nr:sodium/pantothenate symporter [Candidatus Anaerobiospirillum pullicola]
MQQIMPLVPIAIFFVVLLFIGYVAAYKANRTRQFKKEYFLGSQNLGGVVLAMTLVATYGSVSSFVSGPGIAWNLGLGWVVFAAPQIITAFLILGVLAKRMTILTHRTESLTVIDLLYERFHSKAVSLLLALLLIIFFIAMIVGQFIGGAQIFAGLTGIDYSLGLIVFALVTVLYSSGGFRAVALTDAVCAILMLTGMFILGYVILTKGGGLEQVMQTIASVNINEATGISRNLEYDAGGALPLSLLLSTWILVGFATMGLPQSLVRCMTYRSSYELHKSMIIATVICGALMIGMTLLGVLARAVITSLPEGATTDTVIPTLIATQMHPLVAGLTILGPLAATMSTVSSLLIAAASAVIRDLFKAMHRESNSQSQSQSQSSVAGAHDSSLVALAASEPETAAEPELVQEAVKKDLSYHEKVIIKGTTLVMGIIAIVLALYPLDVVAWVNLFAFGGLESSFLWPVILGMFWQRFNRTGVIVSVVAAIAVYSVCMLLHVSLFSCHAIVPSLLAGFMGAVIGTWIGERRGERMDQRTHDIFFPHKPFVAR